MMKALFSFILFFTLSYSLNAQLCTGSLGDPVVHITFGTGNSGPPISPSKISYTYTTSGCPDDGEYTLNNLTFNCFGGSWHTLVGDHTPGDALGLNLLINASFNPGVFYVDTIRGLCPNTNYEFATWVMNMVKPSACNGAGIRPNLTFKIETVTGTVLQTYNSGDIPNEETAIWKQFGTFFNTPAGVSDVVIRLVNNAPGGCGNDIAIDDITFRACGPQVNALVTANNASQISACQNDNKTFTLTANYSAGIYLNPSFQWQLSIDGTTWSDIAGATSNSYNRPPTAIGVYFYRMLIADGANINSVFCRLASNRITVTVSQPDAQVTNYVFGCYGSDVDMFAAGGSTYQWTGPNGFSSVSQSPSIPKVKFTDAGWYKVTVTDFRGCTDSDSTNLAVYPAATAVIGPDVTICEGDSAQLFASGGTRYFWEPGNALSLDTIFNPYASPTDTTVYRLVVINQYGCYDTANMRVNVWKKPIANAGPDRKTRVGIPITLIGSVKGTDVDYYWTPSNFLTTVGQLKPSANPPLTMAYTLHAESRHGCGAHTDETVVKVYERVLVPNAFSPNGDGINDVWIIEPLELFDDAFTEVYNRYGQLVYRSKGYAKPWDGTRNGTPLPVGTYYYSIDLRINKEPRILGSVTIIR